MYDVLKRVTGGGKGGRDYINLSDNYYLGHH